MVRNSGTSDKESIENETTEKLEDDVDALFKLPLAEFTASRNELAARLKRDGRPDDANLVKALAKPSVTAWAVNQLHWKHREALDRLLVTGQHIRQAQTAPTAGRIADLRGLLDARNEALSQLSDLSTALLRDAGHNPTPDTIHRITTTLEAVSAYATPADGPAPGRLTQDVDPPGFASIASLVSGTGTIKRQDEAKKVTPPKEPVSGATKTGPRAVPAGEVQKVREAEETRRARIAGAKGTLQEARRSLSEAQSKLLRSEAAQKKADAKAKEADAEARQAEKQMRAAEERFKKASAASQDATNNAHRIAAETKEAAQGVEDAKRAVEQASKELESLSQESRAK